MSEPPPTVGSLLAGALRTQPSDRLDLELLLGEVLGLNRAGLLRERDTPVNATAAARFASLLGAHHTGRPVAQLLGRREFWSLTLEIDEHAAGRSAAGRDCGSRHRQRRGGASARQRT